MAGGYGDDVVNGGDGDDILKGGGGNDAVFGGRVTILSVDTAAPIL